MSWKMLVLIAVCMMLVIAVGASVVAQTVVHMLGM